MLSLRGCFPRDRASSGLAQGPVLGLGLGDAALRRLNAPGASLGGESPGPWDHEPHLVVGLVVDPTAISISS